MFYRKNNLERYITPSFNPSSRRIKTNKTTQNIPNSEKQTPLVSKWETHFRETIESKILWSLDNGYLNFNGSKIALHSINRQSLLFFKAAMAKDAPAILIYPSLKLTITPLLALEALYFRLHEKKLASGRNQLIVFSSRVELRKEIKDHFLAFKANSMSLSANIFPVGRITSNGDLIKLSKTTIEPKLLISPGPVALPNPEISKKIFGAIIEATSDLMEDQAKDIFDWANRYSIPFVFVVSSDPPTNLAKLMIEKKYLYWGWDLATLNSDCQNDETDFQSGKYNFDQPFCGNYQEIRTKASGVKKVIAPVKEDKLNAMLNDVRKDYYELSRSAYTLNLPAAKETAKRFLGCIYGLEEMTSPIEYAEIELSKRWGTIPLKERINALKNQCSAIKVDEPLFASFAGRSSDKLINIYNYMAEKKTGKHPVILQIIKEAAANEKSVLFITKNEALNEALKRFLEIEKKMDISQLREKHIVFLAASRIYKSTEEQELFDTCILYGCPRYYQKDIFSYARARRVGIIAYESEIPAIKYIQNEIDQVQNCFSDASKNSVVKRLTGFEPKDSSSAVTPRQEKIKTELIFIEPQDAEMGDISPDSLFTNFLSLDWAVDFEYINEAESRSADARMRKDHSNPTKAVMVTLQGGRHILLHEEKSIQVYDESTEKVKDHLAKNLKKGELLILIENSTRKSLAESVISKVESHPSMMKVVVYQKVWSFYLKQALEESGDNFLDIIDKLHTKGAKEPNTALSIYQWVTGRILGPNDLENIRRIGEIYDKPFLVNNYKEIAGAIRRLRTIHSSLARRLNRLIPLAGVEADKGKIENAAIDEELDLYLEDFVNIVSIERIELVEIVAISSDKVLDKVVST
ncbi:MAG: DrmE family protein [Methanoregula sp.]|nr:DrmE family protein [Methanoregula sp.]